MFHTKFQASGPISSGEEDFFMFHTKFQASELRCCGEDFLKYMLFSNPRPPAARRF